MSETDEQLNKRLHELMGLCWHELTAQGLPNWYICTKCKSELHGDVSLFQIDFVKTWEGFGILWEFMQKHKDWEKFIYYYGAKSRALHEYHFGQDCNKLCSVTDRVLVYIDIINPPALAKVVARFFEEE